LAADQPPLRPEERGIVLEVVRSCEPLFAELIAAVVMDDHAHALVQPQLGTSGRRLARAWKGMTAQRLVKEQGRSTPVWQREYFDRWMDSERQVEACVEYIRHNPERRWPGIEGYRWSYLRA
jgi:REP element-mobilizing transposase RayT